MAERHAVIADDSKRAQPFVAGALKAAGIIVDGIADDGRQAVALCRQHHPDIVLLDMSMPVMNGLDAARIIKAESLATYVVLLSSNMQSVVVDQARSIGAIVMSKTNDGTALVTQIRQSIPGMR